ncbi:solute carrier family 25 member 48-like [Branchiostoma floridae]|uniref:Solute carrier family 25 member 48-like n=1 Tax=Branchiostoma floridae TaxID=7739 RepID=A0A9J7M3L8_BRAFL|nr:solute carrier family 25 member 48-like [Branchiostoma floridae]
MGFRVDDFIAGWIGGAAGCFVGYPLDTIKVRLQTNKSGGAVHILTSLVKKEGPLALFKGMSFPLATIAFPMSVAFGANSNSLRKIQEWKYGTTDHKASYTDQAAAACFAGFVQAFVACPIELVKIRLQSQTHRIGVKGVGSNGIIQGAHPNMVAAYRGPFDCIGCIIRQDGFLGIYRGLSSLILRDVPGYAFYFIFYAMTCDLLRPSNGELGPVQFMLAGSVAGLATWASCSPMDVIKSRLQADGVHQKKYKGIIDCTVRSWREGGPKVLFRGLGVNLLRSIPVNATTFLVYEYSMKLLSGKL